LKVFGVGSRAYRQYRNGSFDPDVSATVGQLDGAALLVRRDQFAQLQGWDEGFEFGAEDIDLCARLAQFGPIFYQPAAEIEHLGRISSRANRPFTYRTYECGYVRYLAKHHGGATSCAYKTLVTLDMPVRVSRAFLKTAYYRLRRQQDKAGRSREMLHASSHFLFKGLPGFWKA